MAYKVDYSKEQKTIKIDFSDLGEDNAGKPFYVEIYNPKVLKYGERQQLVKKRIPEGASAKAVKDNANELYATALLKSWNLLDWETGEPVDINQWDALEHVPPAVVDRIGIKAGLVADVTDEELKN